jgi:hypothetical protein
MDSVATLKGGETVLHIAAIFDNESVLYELILAAIKPHTKLCANLAHEQGQLTGMYGATPLQDLVGTLQSAEEDVRARMRTEMARTAAQAPSVHIRDYPDCPCRAVDPGSAWGAAGKTTNGSFASRRRYHTCHGVISREDATGFSHKRQILPGEEAQESMLVRCARFRHTYFHLKSGIELHAFAFLEAPPCV